LACASIRLSSSRLRRSKKVLTSSTRYFNASLMRSITVIYRGAIVGCGAVACQAHVPAWRAASAFQMVAAVDPIPAQRAQLHALLPEVRCYADLATLLAHEELDFLDVCTPPALHEEGILQACAHGLHVLCEKPLTFTAPAMQRIRTAATAANVVVFSVHNWKYAPIVQALKRLLSVGV